MVQRKKGRPSRKRRGKSARVEPDLQRRDERAERRLRLSLYGWSVFTLVCGCLLVLALGHLSYDEVRLDVHHRVAEARVQSVRHGSKVDSAHVRFVDARGVTEQAYVQLPVFGHEPAVGDHVAVEYDPGRPTRARRRGAHDPLALVPLLVLVGGALLLGQRRWRRT